MKFTGGWSDVCYIGALSYSFPDSQDWTEALLPVFEPLNITDNIRCSRNQTAVLAAIREVLVALKSNSFPVGPLIVWEYITTKRLVHDSGAGSDTTNYVYNIVGLPALIGRMLFRTSMLCVGVCCIGCSRTFLGSRFFSASL